MLGPKVGEERKDARSTFTRMNSPCLLEEFPRMVVRFPVKS